MKIFVFLSVFWFLPASVHPASPEAEAARRILDTWHAENPEPGERKLHIVAWRSQDRGFAKDHRERLQRILDHIQKFYAAEMERHGFGPRSIRLDRDNEGRLVVHEVTGAGNHADYGKPDGRKIRSECLPVLRAAGIDAERETILIFTNLVEWDAEKLTFQHKSPYYAGGTQRSGTAWQLDSAELDTSNLPLKTPLVQDGEYDRISLGKHNSIFIGGIAHELGHALGLPHCTVRAGESSEGRTALMGSGNRTYFEEVRGDGPGSFLTLAHALRLASHPQFSGSVKGMNLPARATLADRKVEHAGDGKSFRFSARVECPIPVYAMIAYLDPEGGGDYNARTVVAIPNGQGQFTLVCGTDALVPGKSGELRVVACLANGATSTERHEYRVGGDARVDLETMAVSFSFAPFLDAVETKDDKKAESLLLQWPEDSRERRIARSILLGRRNAARVSLAAKEVPAEVKSIPLSRITPQEASVGWGNPAYDHLPRRDAILLGGGRLYETGIYAHADSKHRYDLSGAGWKEVSGSCGLAPGGGSVVFAIFADGTEVFRSRKLEGTAVETFKLDVSKTHLLELRTEDAKDGKTGDWGIWFAPELRR